jgi:hypothetical protein
MNEHVTTWLGAYHDGELKGFRLRQVEAHLADCATCRAELEQLQTLTTLLQASPAAEGLTPSERFVAQVGLRLPRHPTQPVWKRTLELGWRLAPVGLLGAWVFVQTTFLVTKIVMGALRMGLGGELAAELLPTLQPGLSLSKLFGSSGASLGDVGKFIVQLLNGGGPLGWGVMLNLGSLVVIGLLYWSWLASWWARRQRQNGNGEAR